MAGYSAPLEVGDWPSFHFIQSFPPFSRDTDDSGAEQVVYGVNGGARFPGQAAGTYSYVYRLLSFIAPAPVIIDRVVFQYSTAMYNVNARIGICRFPAGLEAWGSSNPLPWSNVVAGPSPLGDQGFLGLGTGFGSPGVINAAGTYTCTASGYVYEMAITSDNYNQLDAGDGLYLMINSPVAELDTTEPNRVRVTLKGRFVEL